VLLFITVACMTAGGLAAMKLPDDFSGAQLPDDNSHSTVAMKNMRGKSNEDNDGAMFRNNKVGDKTFNIHDRTQNPLH